MNAARPTGEVADHLDHCSRQRRAHEGAQGVHLARITFA